MGRVSLLRPAAIVLIATLATACGQFALPSSGQIYVTDMGNNRILRINDMTGTGWTTFGTPGSGPSQFSGPAGIFVR